MKKITSLKYVIFSIIIFIIYALSFSINILKVTDDNYRFFDRVDETMIIGRLIASNQEHPFAYSGLVGGYSFEHYLQDDNSLRKREYIYDEDGSINQRAYLSSIYDDYVKNRRIHNGKYIAYKSQPGGQGIMYSLLQEILPFENELKLQIIRFVNILLGAFALTIFMSWIYRNFGFLTAFTTFILSAFIPIFILFGYSLWWVLWSYFIPFCILLIILDKRKRKDKPLFDNKLLLYISLLVFLKFFFSGFEFITSTLVMSICPIIFYLILENNNLKDSLFYFFKSSFSALIGLLVGILFLATQIFFLSKDWSTGIDYIIDAFFRRSAFGEDSANISIIDTIEAYLARDVFRFDWNLSLTIKYSTLMFIILGLCFLILFLRKKTNIVQDRKYVALSIATLISILAPLSWFILFCQHASVHSLDIIVWYLPFCLLGFAIIGSSIDILFIKIRKKDQF